MKFTVIILAATMLSLAEADGADYDMGWLRYNQLPPDYVKSYRNRFASFCLPKAIDTPVLTSARKEWLFGIEGLMGIAEQDIMISYSDKCRRKGKNGVILELREDNYTGYRLKSVIECDEPHCSKKIVVRAPTDVGLLWGVFGLLRRMQTTLNATFLELEDSPSTHKRIWNTWDNLDGTNAKPWAGGSIFDWQNLPDLVEKRYHDYARLLASVGTSAISFGNFNSCSKQNEGLLNSTVLSKIAVLAETFGDWGLQVYLVPCLNSPVTVGELSTADPSQAVVQDWWKQIISDIAHRIPNFGGFIISSACDVKHVLNAQSVNALADTLVNGTTLIWRVNYNTHTMDPAMSIYTDFQSLDGEFHDNVELQISVGPTGSGFVREPVSPIFGALEKTPFVVELDVTQKFMGENRSVVALASQWEFYFSQFGLGKGETLANVAKAVAGRGNFGSDPHWTGSVLGMANAYAWGRLAYEPTLTAQQVLDEWILQTFGWEENVRLTLLDILQNSWEVYGNYTAPLGLASMISGEDYKFPLIVDEIGIGADRTARTGSAFISLYDNSVAQSMEKLSTCPEELLLYLHHVSWSHVLSNSKKVIEYLYLAHGSGVRAVDEFRLKWENAVKDHDDVRCQHILNILQQQLDDATQSCTKMVNLWTASSGIASKKSTREICDASFDLIEEELVLEQKERRVAGIGGGLGAFFAICGMIFTAYQMQEFPDGVYASICRVCVRVGTQILRVLFFPCRQFCPKPHYRQGHMPIGQIDYQEPYNNGGQAPYA